MGYGLSSSLVYGLKLPYVSDLDLFDRLQSLIFKETDGKVTFLHASDSCMNERYPGQFACVLAWKALTVPIQDGNYSEVGDYLIQIPSEIDPIIPFQLRAVQGSIKEIQHLEATLGWWVCLLGG